MVVLRPGYTAAAGRGIAGKPPYSVPKSAIETMHRATAELIASGAADKALKVAVAA
jgi:hypothetical protein